VWLWRPRWALQTPDNCSGGQTEQLATTDMIRLSGHLFHMAICRLREASRDLCEMGRQLPWL
jgi:hypothetical protein